MKKLTPKQDKFCLKYMECGNATEAYKSVYNTNSMKPKTINNRAYEMLEKGEIRGRVAELKEETKERAMLSLDDVIAELEKVAMAEKVTNHKLKALDMLGKHLGLYEKKIEMENKMTSKEKRKRYNKFKKELLGGDEKDKLIVDEIEVKFVSVPTIEDMYKKDK